MITTDEQVQMLKENHDQLQIGLSSTQMAIRENIIIEIGEGAYDSYPRFGFQHFCWRNPPCVEELNLFIKYAKDKKFFWDCGAYHGLFSLIFKKLNPDSACMSIEPFPDAYSTMIGIFKMNERISSYAGPFALSDKSGTIKMKLSEGHYVEDENGELEIPCVMGDALADSFPIPPDIIKVDTEGMELKVLEGMYGIISTTHPLIFLELHSRQLTGEQTFKIINLLKFCNYSPIDTRTDKPISWEEIQNFKDGELRIVLQ